MDGLWKMTMVILFLSLENQSLVGDNQFIDELGLVLKLNNQELCRS